MRHTETIRTENLTTGYRVRKGIKVVSDGICGTIRQGELTCLLGPNGAGKSTLLRTLAAFQPPVGGEICLMDRPLGSYAERELARIIGVVLTERINLVNMTVRELVAMGRSPYTGFWGKLSGADEELVAESMRLVGVSGFAGRMVQTLSDGERQKVMIAKALAQETPVIFLDEPSAFLDYPSKVEIMQLLRGLTRLAGKTVFLSTHDLDLALQVADNVWLMDENHQVITGTPEDLALSGDVERCFRREGIRFDLCAGQFRIDPVYSAEVCLSGSGTRREMAVRALARNGIRTGAGPACGCCAVEVEEDIFKVNGKACSCVGELIELVTDTLEKAGQIDIDR